MRGEEREREKSATVGHHLLEKASLPWRVILDAVGRWREKKKRQAAEIHMCVYTRIQACVDTRYSTERWRVTRASAQSRNKLYRLKGKKERAWGAK